MKAVAMFDGHEVSADGVMTEVVHSFGECSELLAIFDENQLRELLTRLGTPVENLRDHNRLELLFLLSSKVRVSEDALRVGAYVTEAFGVSDDDDVLLTLCESLVDFTSFSDDDEDAEEEDDIGEDEEEDDDDIYGEDDEEEDDDDEDDEDAEDQDFDDRLNGVTDDDEEEDHEMIKPKSNSEVLEVNYVNYLGTVRDELLLQLVDVIDEIEDGTTVHTADEVRLWLQRARVARMYDLFMNVPDERDLDAPPRVLTEQRPNTFSDRHVVLFSILDIISPQDPPEDDEGEDDPEDENYVLRS